MLGFSVDPDADDPQATTDEDMAALALEAGAVNVDRVMAFYTARHLIGSKASPEEITGVAQWLTGRSGASVASEVDDEDEDDEEMAASRPTVELRDLWPPVMVSIFRWAKAKL